MPLPKLLLKPLLKLLPKLDHRAILWLTLGVGIGLSVLAAAFVGQWETANRQLRFQRQIENLGTALQRSLNRYTDILAFLSDYYAVEQRPIDRQTFAIVVQRSLRSYSGIQALEWAPVVQDRDRLAYERQVQADGYPTFSITELGGDGGLVKAGQRPFYIPVTYVEPFTDNQSAFGYDLYSNAIRAAAIAHARDIGTIAATGRIRLVQETRDQFSFLVFLPIYQPHQTPDTLAQRRQQFIGVLLGVFRVSDVVEEALQDLQYEIDFSLYDRSTSPSEQFLGHYVAAGQQVITREPAPPSSWPYRTLCPTADACTRTMTVGQRQWAIAFAPSPNYAIEPQYGAIATLLSGLLLTSALVLGLHQLNRELEQAKSLNELRFRFFSMASHELRTPLSTILLSSESLQLNHDQLTDAQKQSNIQRIHRTARRMSQQIADLLMLTRAEVGKLEVHPELVDLDRFCQQVIDEMQMGIRQPITFAATGASSQGFLDKALLQSLLTNLISNAGKYSPADAPIEVSLCCDDHLATLQVCDRGIGIPAADQPRITEPFYRGSNVGPVTGTGLGLAVVKTCVELHHGTWAIASLPNGGTTVTVQLPLE